MLKHKQKCSREAAVEQFQQQIGETPQDLPAQDKHFDPSKSATLKYLKVNSFSVSRPPQVL